MEPINWLEALIRWLEGGTVPPPFKGGIVRVNESEKREFWRLLCRVMTHKQRGDALKMMFEKGFLASFIPELARMRTVLQPEEFHPEGDAFQHALLTLTHLKRASCAQAIAALLHDVGKILTFAYTDRIRFNQHNTFGIPIILSIAKRLRMPLHILKLSIFVCKKHMLLIDITRMRLPRLARLVKSPYFKSLLKIWEADIGASHKDTQALSFTKRMAEILAITPLPRRWLHPLSVSDLRSVGFSHDQAVRLVRYIDLLALTGKVRTKSEALKYVLQHAENIKNNL